MNNNINNNSDATSSSSAATTAIPSFSHMHFSAALGVNINTIACQQRVDASDLDPCYDGI
jgi:hypothetical protein